MKELNIQQLELLISEMRSIQGQHPKANVSYDPERRRINITYPLPEDFDKFEIKDIKIDNSHFRNIKR